MASANAPKGRIDEKILNYKAFVPFEFTPSRNILRLNNLRFMNFKLLCFLLFGRTGTLLT